MRCDWKTDTIENICVRICSGGTPSRKHPEYYLNGSIPWLNTSEIDFSRIYKTENKISSIGLKNSSAKWIPTNAVIVAMYGATAGKVAISGIPLTTNQACCNLIIDEKYADYRYVYYYLCHNYIRLSSLANGGAQQNLSVSLLKIFQIVLPKVEVQKKIAAVLSALDEKIAINRAINENLERQLDAFFENLFHGINGEVALGNVVKTISGGTPSRKHVDYYENGTICWVKSKELSSGYIFDTEEHINDLALAKSSAKIIPPHAILVAMYGATVGSYGIITKAMACNQAICALIDSEIYPYTYLYQIVRTQQRTLTNMAIGSAQQNISQILIKQLPLHNDTDTIAKFHTFAQPLQKRIELLEYENKQIMSIRDTLLPKLMSGEIDVSTV